MCVCMCVFAVAKYSFRVYIYLILFFGLSDFDLLFTSSSTSSLFPFNFGAAMECYLKCIFRKNERNGVSESEKSSTLTCNVHVR